MIRGLEEEEEEEEQRGFRELERSEAVQTPWKWSRVFGPGGCRGYLAQVSFVPDGGPFRYTKVQRPACGPH